MFGSKSKLIRELREEIQRLRELLAEAIGSRDAYREQAREAIGLAKEKHYPEPKTDSPPNPLWRFACSCGCTWIGVMSIQKCPRCEARVDGAFDKDLHAPFPADDPDDKLITFWPAHADLRRLLTPTSPNYIVPQVKHCPECNVSVRSDSWPMECPACHCTFGFEETK